MEVPEAKVLSRISEIESDSRVNLKVQNVLTDPDNLTASAKKALSVRNEDSDWLLRYEGVLTNSGLLSIKVAPKNVGRALRIFDTIIKVFRVRGHTFTESTVNVQGQKYEISIREKLKKVEDYKKLPTDILCIKAYCGYPVFEIYDSKSVLLEEKIARVVARLELQVEALLEIWAKNREREEEGRERERKHLEYVSKKEKELEDFKLLLNAAHRNNEARMIREYIQYTEDKASQTGGVSTDLQNWIIWAREKADWYDPPIESEDELLKEVDRRTLKFQ